MEATNDEQLLDIVMCNSVWLHRFLVKLKFYSSFAFFCTFYTLLLEETALLLHHFNHQFFRTVENIEVGHKKIAFFAAENRGPW